MDSVIPSNIYNASMILHSIAKSFRKQDYSVVLIELLVVIIGLVLAFQIDRWWEERDDRAREQRLAD